MILKVCGMRESSNIREIASLKPDLMGFIFYPKSKRYIGDDFDPGLIQSIMPEIQTVGVFVNEEIHSVIKLAQKFKLDFLQLHGNESPIYCKSIKENGFKVIKAFGVHTEFEWSVLTQYSQVADYFLFDTSYINFGGSGQKFDWNLLSAYQYEKPFLLSGGIVPEDVLKISSIKTNHFIGVDINSGFEIRPALKDPDKVKIFIKEIRTL